VVTFATHNTLLIRKNLDLNTQTNLSKGRVMIFEIAAKILPFGYFGKKVKEI